MTNAYTKLLLELKPILPDGYQQKILKSLPGVKEWHVKHAFSGREVKEKIISRIYRKAFKMAEENKKKITAENKKVSRLISDLNTNA